MSDRNATNGRHAVMSAMDYISRHLAERIHLRDLCAAAGVSERTLGYMFLRAHGETPMAFVKRERVNRARLLLAYADPSTDTVASIARRCGFFHMGQFARDYKRIVGESPSETLNRPTSRRKGNGPASA